ncbi:hypothetical protein HKX48_008832, partial [Thoreauomyces humboldtii]
MSDSGVFRKGCSANAPQPPSIPVETEVLDPPKKLDIGQTALGACTIPLTNLWPDDKIAFLTDTRWNTSAVFQIGFALVAKIVNSDLGVAAFEMHCTPRDPTVKRAFLGPPEIDVTTLRAKVLAHLPPIEVRRFEREDYMVWELRWVDNADAIVIKEEFFRQCAEIDKGMDETKKLWIGILFGFKLLHALGHALMFWYVGVMGAESKG